MLVWLCIFLTVQIPSAWKITLENMGFTRFFLLRDYGTISQVRHHTKLSDVLATTHKRPSVQYFLFQAQNQENIHVHILFLPYPLPCAGFSPSPTHLHTSTQTTFVIWKLAFKSSSLSYQWVCSLKIAEEGNRWTLVSVKWLTRFYSQYTRINFDCESA